MVHKSLPKDQETSIINAEKSYTPTKINLHDNGLYESVNVEIRSTLNTETFYNNSPEKHDKN